MVEIITPIEQLHFSEDCPTLARSSNRITGLWHNNISTNIGVRVIEEIRKYEWAYEMVKVR